MVGIKVTVSSLKRALGVSGTCKVSLKMNCKTAVSLVLKLQSCGPSRMSLVKYGNDK